MSEEENAQTSVHPTQNRRRTWRWSRLHFNCPICNARFSYPRAYALRRFNKDNIKNRSMLCKGEFCQTVGLAARSHHQTSVNITGKLRNNEARMRWRENTPEGRAHYYNKYGPPSGRPIPRMDITTLLNHPRYAEYRRRGYENQRIRQMELRQLLGMFNMARKASYPVLTPQAASRLRGSIMARVPKYLQMADEVMAGERKWSATQARVFSTLLNKVVPDLSASFVQHEHTTRDLRELSREELERIVRGDDAITVEYADVSSDQPRETAPLLEPDSPGTGPGDEGPQSE